MARKRGRPTVAENIYKDRVTIETIITSGMNYRSYRTVADIAYMYSAVHILMEAASDIEHLESILTETYYCRSILSQLGRMYEQNNFDKASVISAAKVAIKLKLDGYSVKDIEAYIRHGRRFNEW